MDKLLLSLSLALVLTSMTVNSAPSSGSKLISTIDLRQKQFTHSTEDNGADDDDSILAEKSDDVRDQIQKVNKISDQRNEQDESTDSEVDDNDQRRGTFINRRDDLLGETGLRHHKMFGLYPFTSFPFSYPAYSAPVFYPPEFYEDFAGFYGGYGDDEDVMSRMSPETNRRRPTGNYKNSPVYYIRLPPTPYMFVPGLGYISQPPSYSPVPQPISPFYNLPLDFISNGKPTSIYQWGSPASQFNPQPQFIQQSPQFDPYPSYIQRPQRPPYAQRPFSPVNPYVDEAKITSLKGPFVFNGRPEEIFLLRNAFNPVYPDPRFSSAYF